MQSEYERYATMTRAEWRKEYYRLELREKLDFLEEKAKLLGVSRSDILRWMKNYAPLDIKPPKKGDSNAD